MVVVYLDGVMGLNFLVDFSLLLGVNRLSGYPPGTKRAAAAAAFGGGYAGACLLPGFSFLANDLWRLVSLGLMSVAAFGMERSAWRRGVLFVVLSMALGGLVTGLDTGNTWGVLLCGALLSLLCRMSFRGKAGQRLIPVRLEYGGKTAQFLALRDTGNTLRDPMTGEAVLVASPKIAEELLGLSGEALKDPVTYIRNGMRLVPYSAVGSSGFLLAARCTGSIGAWKGRVLVGFSPEEFPGGEYQGLTGGQYG